MDFTNYTAGANDQGRRLDKIVKHIFQNNCTSNIYAAIRKKLIKVNGAKTNAGYLLTEGDTISIASFLLNGNAESSTDTAPKTSNKPQQEFETLVKNQHVWIINKPYGINVHASQSSGQDIATIVAKQYRDTTSIAFTPAPLHRLDRYTTGVLAISQSHEGAVWFSSAIASHAIKKTYIGIAEGTLQARTTWQDCIANSPSSTSTFHTVSISQGEKNAVTHAIPLSYGTYRGHPVTLIQYTIETGRKHQIRIQSSSHGHPLLGDTAYTASCRITVPAPHAFFLHAIQLTFPQDNPLSIPCVVTAPLPQEFESFLQFSLIKWDKKLII